MTITSESGSASYGAACCASLARAAGIGALVATLAAPSATDMQRALRVLAPAGAVIERCESLEELALAESAPGAIALVEAGALWAWPSACSGGAPNHAVRIVEVIRDPVDERVVAARVEDPARPGAAGLVDATTLVTAWLEAGGYLIVAAPSGLD